MRLLFIHGWGTNSAVWIHQMPLAEEIELTLVDLPGHGSPERWDTLDFQPGIKMIENVLSDRQPTLAIGWSLGGELLLSLDTARSPGLRGMVTIGTTPSFVARNGFPFGVPQGRVKKMKHDLLRAFDDSLKKFYPLVFSPQEKREPAFPEWLAVFEKASRVLSPEDLIRCLDSISNEDCRPRLPKIRIPTLIIHGTLDEVCPFGASDYLLEALPNARKKTFNNAGHAPFITEPEAFNKIIRAFAGEIESQ